MKLFSRFKRLTFYLVFAAQACLLLFQRNAFATLYAPTPDKFPQPPARSLFAPVSSPFIIHVDEKTKNHTVSSKVWSNVKKLGKAMHRFSYRNIKENTPKDPLESVESCARHVVSGLHAVGIPVKRGHAKNLPPNLLEAGYKKINASDYSVPLPGDVAIIKPPDKNHPYGHAAVLCPNGYWYSDYKQGKGKYGAWCYGNKVKTNLISFYRHSAFSGEENQKDIKRDYRIAVNHAFFTTDKLLAQNNLPNPLPTVQKPETGIAFIQHGQMPLIRNHDTAAVLTPFTFSFAIGYSHNRGDLLENIHIASKSSVAWRQEEQVVVHTPSSQLGTLQEQWHMARKAVLKHNAAIKRGTTNEIAQAKLRQSIIKMHACAPEAMKSNPVVAFKALRYVLNKFDDKTLFANSSPPFVRNGILDLIKANMDELSRWDARLGKQAATYVAKKSDRPPIFSNNSISKPNSLYV